MHTEFPAHGSPRLRASNGGGGREFCTLSKASIHSLTSKRNFNLLSALFTFRNSGYTYTPTGKTLWCECLLYQRSIPENICGGGITIFLDHIWISYCFSLRFCHFFLSLFPYVQILITSFSQKKYLLLCFNYWFNLNFFPLDKCCTTGW